MAYILMGNNRTSQQGVLVNGFLSVFQVIVECSCYCFHPDSRLPCHSYWQEKTTALSSEKCACLLVYYYFVWLVVCVCSSEFINVCPFVFGSSLSDLVLKCVFMLLYTYWLLMLLEFLGTRLWRLVLVFVEENVCKIYLHLKFWMWNSDKV